ncbi:hypothetical protein GTID1_13205 [Geobacillus thermodenitrificans]|nr:hypothetical protein [Geobacillus thermodenitrificans]ATO38053.1 hypothetical protein GTID1_13205 [Geobacillus thermodenitrificans]
MKKILILISIFIFILAGCGRDTSTVEKAIIGHWVSKSDNKKSEDTHYYIGENKIIMVDQGNKTTFDYRIVRSNEKKGWIEIKIITPEGGGHNKELTFTNKDRTKIKEKINIQSMDSTSEFLGNQDDKEAVDVIKTILGDMKLEDEWTYVDDATEPKE